MFCGVQDFHPLQLGLIREEAGPALVFHAVWEVGLVGTPFGL